MELIEADTLDMVNFIMKCIEKEKFTGEELSSLYNLYSDRCRQLGASKKRKYEKKQRTKD